MGEILPEPVQPSPAVGPRALSAPPVFRAVGPKMAVREYPAVCLGWHDGDTLRASVDTGFYNSTEQSLRLVGSRQGVNAPELNAADPAVRVAARASLARVMELLPPGAPFFAVTEQTKAGDPKTTLGRFLCQVILLDGTNVGDLLLAEGLAVPYVRG